MEGHNFCCGIHLHVSMTGVCYIESIYVGNLIGIESITGNSRGINLAPLSPSLWLWVKVGVIVQRKFYGMVQKEMFSILYLLNIYS